MGFNVCRRYGQLDELFIDRMAGYMVKVFQGFRCTKQFKQWQI